MRIAVIGAGAMGSLFGGRLAEAGQEVVLIDVSPAQIGAINRDGLLLDDGRGARRIQVTAGTADAFTGPCDLLIVFTKGPHTRAAVASVRHLVGPESWALTLQNGLGNAEAIAEVLPSQRIAVGMTNLPADLKGPGHVASHGDGEIRIWTADGRADEAVERIRAALDGAGLPCTADPQVEVAIWEKVAFNAAMNSITAVTRLTVGEVADRPAAHGIVYAIVAETMAVARARGLAVDEERVRRSIAHAFANHRSHKPSMLQDILAGRPTEIDSIAGVVVAEGERLGVPTPVTTTMHRLVRTVQVQN